MDKEIEQPDQPAGSAVDSTKNAVWVYFLAWLAFAVVFFVTVGVIVAWPLLRGVDQADAAHVLSAMASGLLFTSVAVGLAVRDYVLHRLRGDKRSELPRSGCFLVALPASFIAFFCTCAPVGLIAAGESSVRPDETNWSSEIWIAAWIFGLIAVVVTARRRRRDRAEQQRKAKCNEWQ